MYAQLAHELWEHQPTPPAPGLPSGRGSSTNPIVLPGVEVRPALNPLVVVIGLLVLLWAVSEG